jgi:hypothetical protein
MPSRRGATVQQSDRPSLLSGTAGLRPSFGRTGPPKLDHRRYGVRGAILSMLRSALPTTVRQARPPTMHHTLRLRFGIFPVANIRVGRNATRIIEIRRLSSASAAGEAVDCVPPSGRFSSFGFHVGCRLHSTISQKQA